MDNMDQTGIQTNSRAVKITVKGRVQGVGFRPFIFQIADKYCIKGTVQNNMDGVKIYAEGNDEHLDRFIRAISSDAPRLSRIDEVFTERTDVVGYQHFDIIESERSGKSSLVIPIDSAVCPECLTEMKERNNFRYQYPFINCTQCGPRYTIIDSLPYDRPMTAMKDFHMCEACASEYNNPLNRRHHAQPIACAECGPHVSLAAITGEVIAENGAAIETAASLLQAGKIVAIKGIGGYHLACDAEQELAVRNLRERKRRPNRPLAVMVKSIDIAENECNLTEEERTILQSPEAPIVLLNKGDRSSVTPSVAPGLNTLGVILPYAPLHHLLFEAAKLSMLVMTSANPSGLPMLYQDDEAFQYLEGIADYVLFNNRPILHPLDDSVVQVVDGKLSFLRRSRGYVPDPFITNQPVHRVVALGSQQKNTFAIGRNEQIFIGPHIGEMENIEVADHFCNEFAHLMKWMGIESNTIAVDMHPGYMTRELGQQMDGEIIEVQHHHAHLVSCMEDNRLVEPQIGIILDGTGYGEDGRIWGFEFLYGDACSYKRLAHLQYTHLPGNEKAIAEPWRNATAMLIDYFGDEGKELAFRLFNDKEYEIDILTNMLKREINSPLAGTCGRLFDAVSAIIGICELATYDGEAAIKLSEQMVPSRGIMPYSYKIKENDGGLVEIDFGPALFEIVHERLQQKKQESIVQRFHETVVVICVEVVTHICSRNPLLNRSVVLSGGSFHNQYLALEITERLRDKGFSVYSHSRVPCNDGGLSLGQLVIAANQRIHMTRMRQGEI